ncbi:hypothetical protein M9Y10_017184, partial [Tritrichomonas musculus]
KTKAVHYIHYPESKPTPTPDGVYYKTYHNLADMMISMIENDKTTQITKRILYETFNEKTWEKFISGIIQYHYSLQEQSLKKVGYKYKGCTDLIEADQIIEIKSPSEFVEKYMKNEKDNMTNIEGYAISFLGLYLFSVILNSGITYFLTKRSANSRRVTVIPHNEVEQTMTLGRCLNKIFENLGDLIQAHNELSDYVDTIKSCDCNHDNQGGDINQGGNQGNGEEEDINQGGNQGGDNEGGNEGGGNEGGDDGNNNSNQIQYMNVGLQAVNELSGYLLRNMTDIQNNLAAVRFQNGVQSFTQEMFDYEIFQNGLDNMNRQYQAIGVQTYQPTRQREALFNDSYVWFPLFRMWTSLSVYNIPNEFGWRANPAYVAPWNFVLDVGYGDWIAIAPNEDDVPAGWRINRQGNNIAQIILTHNLRDEGEMIYNLDRGQWEYYPPEESIVIPEQPGPVISVVPEQNRNARLRPTYVWSIESGRWVNSMTIANMPETNPNDNNDWRRDISFSAPANFVWDIDHREWIAIRNNVSEMIYDRNWRTSHEIGDIAVIHYRDHFLNGTGELVWNDDYNSYVYHGNDVSPLLEDEGNKTSSGTIAIPDQVTDTEAWDQILDCVGIPVINNPNEIDEKKPVQGKFTIKDKL